MAYFPCNNVKYDNIKEYEYDLCKKKVLDNAYTAFTPYYSDDVMSGGWFVEDGICYVYMDLTRNHGYSYIIYNQTGSVPSLPKPFHSRTSGTPTRSLYIKDMSNSYLAIGVNASGWIGSSWDNVPLGHYEIFGAYEVITG